MVNGLETSFGLLFGWPLKTNFTVHVLLLIHHFCMYNYVILFCDISYLTCIMQKWELMWKGGLLWETAFKFNILHPFEWAYFCGNITPKRIKFIKFKLSFEYFWKYYGNRSISSKTANAPFSILFSKKKPLKKNATLVSVVPYSGFLTRKLCVPSLWPS